MYPLTIAILSIYQIAYQENNYIDILWLDIMDQCVHAELKYQLAANIQLLLILFPLLLQLLGIDVIFTCLIVLFCAFFDK